MIIEQTLPKPYQPKCAPKTVRPQKLRSWLLTIWTAVTREQIAVVSPRRHLWKTAIDPMSIKKYNCIWKFWKKCKFWIFRKWFFWQFSKKFKTFVSRYLVSSFEMFFWLGLRRKTQLTRNFQAKWVITVYWGMNYWLNKVGDHVIFGWRHWGLKNYNG